MHFAILKIGLDLWLVGLEYVVVMGVFGWEVFVKKIGSLPRDVPMAIGTR